MHKPATLPYIFACIGLYIFDHVARLIKSRLAIAQIRPLPELDLTRVVIPTINAGWRAGQHVRLRVISFNMGWFAWAEVHPFTIANIAESGPEGMVLMCKRAGGWTRKLYEVAKLGSYEGEGGGAEREVRVVVEGPYGSYFSCIWVTGPHGFIFWCRRPTTRCFLLLLRRRICRRRQRDHVRTFCHPRPCAKGPMRRFPRQNHRAHLDRPEPRLSRSYPPNAINARTAVRVHPVEDKHILYPCANRKAARVLRGGKRQSIRRVGAWTISVFSIASAAALCRRPSPIPTPLRPDPQPLLLRATTHLFPPWPNSCPWKTASPQIPRASYQPHCQHGAIQS